jgi:hypothetical protein
MQNAPIADPASKVTDHQASSGTGGATAELEGDAGLALVANTTIRAEGILLDCMVRGHLECMSCEVGDAAAADALAFCRPPEESRRAIAAGWAVFTHLDQRPAPPAATELGCQATANQGIAGCGDVTTGDFTIYGTGAPPPAPPQGQSR